MSSYLSQPYQAGQPLELPNVGIIRANVKELQTQYDYNKSIIDQTLAKYESLRGLSDSDNEYIAAKVKEAESIMKSYGRKNGDLSMSTTRDTMLSALEGVYKDPVVQNAVQNKAVYDNFNAGVAKIKEKDGGKYYSNTNYQDALEQGGVQAYMQGKTKKLGNLNYNEYVNLPEKVNKIAEEYIKEVGIERLLDSTTGEYYLSDVYGKRVTQEEIYNRISSGLDEKDKTQLQINTRQSLGKMSAQDLDLKVKPILTEKITNIKENKAKVEAQIASETDKSKKDKLKLQLINFDENIKNYSEQLEKKNYNIYSIYEDSFLNNVASNYDMEIITDIKRDKLPLEIKEFEFDQISKQREYDLKVREVQAKEAETEALTSPTTIEKPQVGEIKKSSDQILNEAVVDSDEALNVYLKKSNENGYNQKSANEQWAYKTSLKTGDPSMTIEKQNLIKNFSTSLEGRVKVINKNTEILKNKTSEIYNSIEKERLSKIAEEMPFTTSLLKQGKRFENLDANQQNAVMLEIGSNMANNLSKEDKKPLMSALNSINAKLANSKSEKVGGMYSIAKKSFYGTLYKKPIIENAPMELQIVAEGVSKLFPKINPMQDKASITKSMLNDMNNNSRKIADGYKENLSSNKAMAWSTESAGQKADAIRIQQSIQTEFPNLELPTTNNYIVSRKGSGFEINFDAKNGKDTERITKYVDRLDDETLRKLNLQEQKWHSNFNNPNLVLPEFNFGVKTRKEAINIMKDIAKNRPDLIPANIRRELINRGSVANTEFQSDQDIEDWVKENYSNITQPQQVKITEIINSTYKVNYEVVDGEMEGTISVPNTDIMFTFGSRQKELDEGKLYVETLQQINNYKLSLLEKALNGGSK